jgi:hypothetical protein
MRRDNLFAVTQYVLISVVYLLILGLILYQVNVLQQDEAFMTYTNKDFAKYFADPKAKPPLVPETGPRQDTDPDKPDDQRGGPRQVHPTNAAVFKCASNGNFLKSFATFDDPPPMQPATPPPPAATPPPPAATPPSPAATPPSPAATPPSPAATPPSPAATPPPPAATPPSPATVPQQGVVAIGQKVKIKALSLDKGSLGYYCVPSYTGGQAVLNDGLVTGCANNTWVLLASSHNDNKFGPNNELMFGKSFVNIVSPDRTLAWARNTVTGYIVLKSYVGNDPDTVFATRFLHRLGSGQKVERTDAIPYPQSDTSRLKMRFVKPLSIHPEADVVPTKDGAAWSNNDQDENYISGNPWIKEQIDSFDANKDKNIIEIEVVGVA